MRHWGSLELATRSLVFSEAHSTDHFCRASLPRSVPWRPHSLNSTSRLPCLQSFRWVWSAFGEERWGDQWGVSGRTGLGIYSPGFLQATGSGRATSHSWVNPASRILLGDFHFFWPLRQRDGKSSLSQPQLLVPSPGVSLLAYAFVIIPFI